MDADHHAMARPGGLVAGIGNKDLRALLDGRDGWGADRGADHSRQNGEKRPSIHDVETEYRETGCDGVKQIPVQHLPGMLFGGI